jgi:hypothetical protein
MSLPLEVGRQISQFDENYLLIGEDWSHITSPAANAISLSSRLSLGNLDSVLGGFGTDIRRAVLPLRRQSQLIIFLLDEGVYSVLWPNAPPSRRYHLGPTRDMRGSFSHSWHPNCPSLVLLLSFNGAQ